MAKLALDKDTIIKKYWKIRNNSEQCNTNTFMEGKEFRVNFFLMTGAFAAIILIAAGFFYWQSVEKDGIILSNQNVANLNITAVDQKSKTVVAPSTGKELIVEGVAPVAIVSTAVTAKEAYELILAEAKKWKEDAVLVSLLSDSDVALDGKSAKWQARFISKSDLTKGWKAVLKDKAVGEASEEQVNAKIIVEPPFTVNSGEAIKAGLGDLGASEVKVTSIRLFQETFTGEWFWSIASDKGNITLKAK